MKGDLQITQRKCKNGAWLRKLVRFAYLIAIMGVISVFLVIHQSVTLYERNSYILPNDYDLLIDHRNC